MVHPASSSSAPVRTSETLVDAELVRRFHTGDESAFLEIMRRHQAKILHVALGLLHNHADAEEIAQDTFIRAHRALARFRGDSSLATWLHRIATNLARNRYWYFFRRRRHATLSLDATLGVENDATFADLCAADAPDPAQENSREEFTGLVARCMEKLEPRHREILTLRNVLNHSYEEIAQHLGLNVGTVKSRIARARQNLRAQLAAMCPEFEVASDPRGWFESARATGLLVPVRA